MRPRLLSLLACALLFGATPLAAAPDGELWAQIELVSKDLRKNPRRADLFLRRADLLRRFRQFPGALADVKQARRLDPALSAAGRIEGRILRDAGHTWRALRAYGEFLEHNPNVHGARLERAQLWASVNRLRSAVRDYDHVIAGDAKPSPDVFMARHDLQLRQGPGLRSAALAGLETGLTKLGPIISLELPALQLETELGHYERALARIERIAKVLPRLDGWWLHRAEVLRAAGRQAEAQSAYRSALNKLAQVPASRRRMTLVQDMIRQAQAGLDG
ncbi:MAG: tetratricopeptide (TPR) repeat protein [Planctomycetota bacterium]|jgi:tetratricopeptide (TPR) repeat protein